MNFGWLHIKRPRTYTSKIHGIITVGTSKNKGLFAGGVTQSGGEIAKMWDTVIHSYYQQFPKPKTILVLGVGGGSVIHAIRNHDQKTRIIGVEKDPVMKQIASNEFGLKDDRKQTIIIADAISYIDKEKKHYDLIIVDLYIGPLNPVKSRTKVFLQKLKKTMKSKGAIFYNAHYQKKNSSEYEKFRKVTDTLFTQTEEVFSYPLNRVLRLQR